MPLIESSSYNAPWWTPSPHWQTILPNVTRRRLRVSYRRERFELPDGDFVDVDWAGRRDSSQARRCALILHGLEGNSRAPYAKAMVKALDKAGYASGVLNFRGCSGAPNRLKRFYHSGDTADLIEVVARLSERYSEIYIVGFSLGGNAVLKGLGEAPGQISPSVRAAAVFSVPCDLRGASERLAEAGNAFYMKRFMRLLCAKLRAKERLYPHHRYDGGCSRMRTFREFDDAYTAPLNGFRDAFDYWERCSSLRFLDKIEIPTLLVNARNDPFLSDACFPLQAARSSECFYLEIPAVGGHCGFPGDRRASGYWHERRALAFFEAAATSEGRFL